MADSSTTAGGIPILFPEGCWAHRQLHAGIRSIPTPSIFMKLPCPGVGLGGGMPSAWHPAPGEGMSLSEVPPVLRYSTSIRIGNLIDYFNGIYEFKYCDLGQERVEGGPLA